MEYHYNTVTYQYVIKDGWDFKYKITVQWHGQSAWLYGGWMQRG